MFQRIIKEEVVSLNKANLDEPECEAPPDDGMADVEMSSEEDDDPQSPAVRRMDLNPAEEDPPVDFQFDGEVNDGKHWKTLLNRNPTLDPQYRVVLEEEFQEIWKELELDSNIVFLKELNDEERDQLRSVRRAYAHVIRR